MPDPRHDGRGADAGAGAASCATAGSSRVGISLDSDEEAEHDRLRGRAGAFRSALQALQIARDSGLYPYVVSVATREFLQRSRFMPFLRFAAEAGALEVHLLEPSATGRLAGRTDVLLTAPERQQIFDYQAEVAQTTRSSDPLLVCLPGIARGIRLRRRPDAPVH